MKYEQGLLKRYRLLPIFLHHSTGRSLKFPTIGPQVSGCTSDIYLTSLGYLNLLPFSEIKVIRNSF